MDIELFAVFFGIFTMLGYYGSVPGTLIHTRATLPERVFGALQLTSVLHTSSTAYAHFQDPTESGQPTLEAASSSISSMLLPELESVLEKIKEVEINRSAVVFYYPPGATVTSTGPWSTSIPNTGDARMTGHFQQPPAAPENPVLALILSTIADTPHTFTWFLFSMMMIVALTGSSRRNSDHSSPEAKHSCCAAVDHGLSRTGFVERPNATNDAAENEKARTNSRFDDLNGELSTIKDRTRKLNKVVEELQNKPQVMSSANTVRFTSIENDVESIRQSLASKPKGLDYQVILTDLERDKLSEDKANEKFASLKDEIRALREEMYSKTDEKNFQSLVRDLRKNASDHLQLSDRLDDETKVLRQALGSKATAADFEPLIAELRRTKMDKTTADDQFSSFDHEIKSMKRTVDGKAMHTDFGDSRKEYNQQLIERLNREMNLMKPTVDSKANITDHEILSIALKKAETDIQTLSARLNPVEAGSKAPEDSTFSQAKLVNFLAEFEVLKREVREQNAKPARYQDTGSPEKRPEDTAGSRTIEPKSNGEEIRQSLNDIQASMDSKVGAESLQDLETWVSNLAGDIRSLSEQQKSVQEQKPESTPDLEPKISELRTEMEALKKLACRCQKQGVSEKTQPPEPIPGSEKIPDLESKILKLGADVEELKKSACHCAVEKKSRVPIPAPKPSKLDTEALREDIAKAQKAIQAHHEMVEEFKKNPMAPAGAFNKEFDDLKRDLKKAINEITDIRTLETELPALKKKFVDLVIDLETTNSDIMEVKKLGDGLPELKKGLVDLESDLGNVDGQIWEVKELGECLPQLKKNLEEVNKATTTINRLEKNHIERLDDFKKEIRDRLAELEKEIEEKKDIQEKKKSPDNLPPTFQIQLNTFKKRIEGAEKSLEEISEQHDKDVTKLKERMEVVENSHSKEPQPDEIQKLNEAVKRIEEQLGDTIDEKLEQKIKTIEEVGRSKNLPDNVISDIKKELEKMFLEYKEQYRVELKTLEGRMTAAEGRAQKIESNVSNLTDRKEGTPFHAIDTRLKAIDKQVDINKRHIREADDRITKISLRTTENGAQVNRNKNLVSACWDMATGWEDAIEKFTGKKPTKIPGSPWPEPKVDPADGDSKGGDDSDDSDDSNDADGQEPPPSSAPRLGKYAVTSPAALKASSSKADAPSPSIPSVKSGPDTNTSVLGSVDSQNTPKGKEDKKPKDPRPYISIWDPKHPRNLAKKTDDNPDDPSKDGEGSHSSTAAKVNPKPGDEKKLGISTDVPKGPTDTKDPTSGKPFKKDSKNRSRWDPEYDGDDGRLSPTDEEPSTSGGNTSTPNVEKKHNPFGPQPPKPQNPFGPQPPQQRSPFSPQPSQQAQQPQPQQPQNPFGQPSPHRFGQPSPGPSTPHQNSPGGTPRGGAPGGSGVGKKNKNKKKK